MDTALAILVILGVLGFVGALTKGVGSPTSSSDGNRPDPSTPGSSQNRDAPRRAPSSNTGPFWIDSPNAASWATYRARGHGGSRATPSRPPPASRTASSAVFHHAVDSKELGQRDALDGHDLMPGEATYFCQNCHVVYGSASYSELSKNKDGRCFNCDQPQLKAQGVRLASSRTGPQIRWKSVEESRPAQTLRGRVDQATESPRAEPPRIGKEDYLRFIDRVVQLSGTVTSVSSPKSRSGSVLYMDRPGDRDGFKIYVVSEVVRVFGGGESLRSLTQREIRVRGQIKVHPMFGPQIVVTHPDMLEVI